VSQLAHNCQRRRGEEKTIGERKKTINNAREIRRRMGKTEEKPLWKRSFVMMSKVPEDPATLEDVPFPDATDVPAYGSEGMH